ncbi:MAG: hypothetical protein E6I04_00780 [Chloroflexi bacterium]|nr:MAG: hypothetical protein E6I36_12030 [Chloroflexota bacterium]TMG00256.1 MAG: hypothetical protein E6I04_00780 [Chloroflexota bacterium]
MSLPGRRLLATLAALGWIGMISLNALAAALPDSTWIQLQQLPGQGRTALFALAVDPANNRVVVAANSQGSLLRSTNGGTAWASVHAGSNAVNVVSFSPNAAGFVLAGTRGGGALFSRDGGATWSNARGLEGRNVRVFGFALTLVAAGTDHGVFTSPDGATWTSSGLTDRSIGALAVEAIHDPVRLVAGTDVQATGGTLPLYQSLDGGATWNQLNPPLSGTMTVKLAAGPLPPTGNVRPLLAGTNTGLFSSNDNGASFTPLSGGGLLPTTDYTQVAFITAHHDRFYAGSDGGGSKSGGLWRTNDGGQTFNSLQPPQPSVTALAVSNDEQPLLYVATFEPATHAVVLWAYHDTGGQPVGPPVSPVASAPRIFHGSDASTLSQILASPQLPYIGLGLGALAVILTAIVAHLRSRYR